MRWHFVDKITEIIPWEKAKGIKVVSFEEYSLKKMWGEKGVIPQSLLIESVFQLGAWLVMYSSGFKIQPVIVKIERIDCDNQAVKGNVLDLEVQIDSRNEDGIIMSGTVSSAGKTIIRGRRAIAMFRRLDEFQKPAQAESLFNYISTFKDNA